MENILCGLRGASTWEATDWNHNKLFSKFKDYVLDEERKLKTILRRLAYNIDQDNTLNTLMGNSRPEKVRCHLLTRLQNIDVAYCLNLLVCTALAVPLVRAGVVDHEHCQDLEGVKCRVFHVGKFNMDGNRQHAQPSPQVTRLDVLVRCIPLCSLTLLA